MNPEFIKAVVGILFVIAGSLGFVFPDGSESAINDAVIAVGAAVLLFTRHGDIRRSS